MKPDWDQLGDEYAASSSVVIGDVDCTAEGESLCSKFEVKGYPTIKYFLDGDMAGAPWEGGRDYDSLKAHIDDNLDVKCLVSDPANTGCDEKQQKYIAKMTEKAPEERTKQLARLEKMKGDDMAKDLKKWLVQRIAVLKQFESDKDEL